MTGEDRGHSRDNQRGGERRGGNGLGRGGYSGRGQGRGGQGAGRGGRDSRDGRGSSDRSYGGSRGGFRGGDRDRKPYGGRSGQSDRSRDGERRSYGRDDRTRDRRDGGSRDGSFDRTHAGERSQGGGYRGGSQGRGGYRPKGEGDRSRGYGDRAHGRDGRSGERRFNDRDGRSGDREARSYGGRDSRNGGNRSFDRSGSRGDRRDHARDGRSRDFGRDDRRRSFDRDGARRDSREKFSGQGNRARFDESRDRSAGRPQASDAAGSQEEEAPREDGPRLYRGELARPEHRPRSGGGPKGGGRGTRPVYAGRGRGRDKATPARVAALDVVKAVRVRNAFAHELIGSRIDEALLTPEDKAFATRLVLGVVSGVGTLDELIDRCLESPDDISPDVRDALRVSAYELVYLSKTPYAAVDQGVELVRSVAPRAAGLANAVLRKMVAERMSFPFGDPNTDTAALARLYAFPQWLCERLIDELGRDAACAFMAASNEPAPTFLAVNSIKATDEQVLSTLAKGEVEAASVSAVPGCVRLADSRMVRSDAARRLFRSGKILASDAAAQAIARGVLAGRPAPKSFLEVGSGRATKTILLQSNAKRLFGDQLMLTALDNRSFKTELLEERAERYGITVARAVTADATDPESLSEVLSDARFDEVFIDAPCSGIGTMRRHPEIRWRIKPDQITTLAQNGLAMLKAVSAHVAVGGVLAFATCTVLREENDDVVRAFLASKEGRGFRLIPFGESEQAPQRFATQLRPGTSDAHFAVRMVRDFIPEPEGEDEVEAAVEPLTEAGSLSEAEAAEQGDLPGDAEAAGLDDELTGGETGDGASCFESFDQVECEDETVCVEDFADETTCDENADGEDAGGEDAGAEEACDEDAAVSPSSEDAKRSEA